MNLQRLGQIKQLNEPIEVKITEWNTGGLLTRIEVGCYILYVCSFHARLCQVLIVFRFIFSGFTSVPSQS